MFLQSGIPRSLQNYDDEVSESLQVPTLPRDFDQLADMEKFQHVEVLRKRQLHYFYVKMTAEMNMNTVHYDALAYEFSTLRRRLFHHAREPWEGDSINLKADLANLVKKWTGVTRNARAPCPISFTDNELTEYLRIQRVQYEADEQFQACQEAVGAGSEGWVPVARYDESKRRERELRADAISAAETEDERKIISENWIFDDFNEEEYT